jgi:iron complex transport system substrate-binding protein
MKSLERYRLAVLVLLLFLFIATPAAAGDRIVAVGGVVTEIVYALGAQERLVGVDSTSLHPPAALADNPDIGYVRALSAEGVLSLGPDRVIAVEAAGPPDALALIAQAGVAIDTVSEDLSGEGVLARIARIGALVERPDEARELAEKVSAGLRELDAKRAGLKRPVRVLFVLSIQNGQAMVGGRNTSADAAIRLAGGKNAAHDIDGFKPITDEAIIVAAPDVILTINHGDHALSADDVFSLPAFSATPAAATRRLIAMDGLYLLGFGPRMPQAMMDLMDALYPRAGLTARETRR